MKKISLLLVLLLSACANEPESDRVLGGALLGGAVGAVIGAEVGGVRGGEYRSAPMERRGGEDRGGYRDGGDRGDNRDSEYRDRGGYRDGGDQGGDRGERD